MMISGNEQRTEGTLPEWVKLIPEEEATKREAWPPRAHGRDIPWTCPTHEIYADPEYDGFEGVFSSARQKLDYSYHRNPARTRQEFQDTIIGRVIKEAEDGDDDNKSQDEEEEDVHRAKRRPWLVFSAGPMGVGKGYVLSTLNEKGLFPLNRFLKIDPDKIKNELPEMAGYLKSDPSSAATKVHRESTQMADVLLEYALQARLPTLVDGSLRDVDFYQSLIKRIREQFPYYQLAIIHVTASPDIIRSRAESRAKKTGRAVPEELLQESIDQVPKSVKALSSKVDATFTISNEDGQPMELIPNDNEDEGGTKTSSSSLLWKDFRATWWQNINSTECQDHLLQHLPTWCESFCPGKCRMGKCFDDPQHHEEAKRAWEKAYPSFCPRCTLASDAQCGLCIHDRHLCGCHECSVAAR